MNKEALGSNVLRKKREDVAVEYLCYNWSFREREYRKRKLGRDFGLSEMGEVGCCLHLSQVWFNVSHPVTRGEKEKPVHM